MSAAPRVPVLVVEDEESIRAGLCDVLSFHGYEAEGAERGDEGLRLALGNRFALVILDIMLPGMNGFDVCEKLREAQPRIPILMLTARGSEDDVLRGFRCGADDYLTKPFSLAELLARVEALLRRTAAPDSPREPEAPEHFDFGGWKVDPQELVAHRGDARVDLTRRDVEILSLFRLEAGRIVSRRRLLHEIWGYPQPERVETRTVDMHIAKLRKKLEASSLIETVRGEGYRFSG